MKVWVVEFGCYEQSHVAGIYLTLEAAKAAWPSRKWKEQEDGSWWYGDGLTGCNSIEPVEVQK